MKQYNYKHFDLSNDELTKEHVRHMIGGPTLNANHENIYEVTLPERPGALGDFLQTIGIKWNISLFHYRNAASDYGNVLIGFETTDRAELERSLLKTNLEFTRVNDKHSITTFVL